MSSATSAEVDEVIVLAVLDVPVEDVVVEDALSASVRDASRLTAESELDELVEVESLEETPRVLPWWW